MEDFDLDFNKREKIFDFINKQIELDIKNIYAKNYNIDFLFEDFLINKKHLIFEHFSDQIDNSSLNQITKEFSSDFRNIKDENEFYLNKGRLESLLDR